MPDLDSLEGKWIESVIHRAEGHTLVSPERRAALARTVMEVQGVPGDLAEVGTYQGGTAAVMASCCPAKLLHVFDTFSGIPADDVFPEGHKAGDFACSLEEVQEYLAGWNVLFHAGYFPDTAKGLEDIRFAAVHLDADLYQTTKDGIDFFWPRLSEGGYLVFDDWKWKHCPGVEKAVREHFRDWQIEESAPFQCRVRKTGPIILPSAKTAYLVCGPESSGNKMLTGALLRSTAGYGDDGDTQRLGDGPELVFPDPLPDTLVLRRSIPHGGIWPDLSALVRQLYHAGYTVQPVIVFRDPHYTALSAVRRGHVSDMATASRNVVEALRQAFTAEWLNRPAVVYYEAFVTSESVRQAFFTSLGLSVPELEIWNADERYERHDV